MERYPDTYKFPKRIFKTSPITTENIYLEFEKFFEQIMEYTDSNYLESEKIMGVKIQNTAFAKAGFKESFVSSFWSARQRLLNRKKTLDGYIDAFENDRHREVLLEKLLAVEANLGRVRSEQQFGPRVVDLDLLLFDQVQMDTPRLTLPHPRMHLRRFVLEPLFELEGDLTLPGGREISFYLAQARDQAAVLDEAAKKTD